MAVRATVTRVDADDVGRERLRELRGKVRDDITLAVGVDAERGAPIDTGRMVRTIDVDTKSGFGPVPTEGGLWAHGDIDSGFVYVGSDEPDEHGTTVNQYWPSVEYGSVPHEIVSHGDWSLHNEETGEYFGHQVHHPGTSAQPFMRPAIYQRRELGRYE